MAVSGKEILAFFILICMNGIYSSYGYIIDYHMSYIKEHHPEYSKPFIYATVIFLDLGLVIANYVLNPLIFHFGISNTIRIGGMVFAIACAAFMFCQNIFIISVGYFLTGITNQFYTFTALFYLGSKCKSDLVKNTGYVFAGYSLSYIIWGGLAAVIINPNNAGQTVRTVTSEGVEYIFPKSVSDRVPLFFFIFGIANLAVSMIVSIFLSCVDNTDSKVSMIQSCDNSIVNFSEDERNKMMKQIKKKTHLMKIFTYIINNRPLSKSFSKDIGKIDCEIEDLRSHTMELYSLQPPSDNHKSTDLCVSNKKKNPYMSLKFKSQHTRGRVYPDRSIFRRY